MRGTGTDPASEPEGRRCGLVHLEQGLVFLVVARFLAGCEHEPVVVIDGPFQPPPLGVHGVQPVRERAQLARSLGQRGRLVHDPLGPDGLGVLGLVIDLGDFGLAHAFPLSLIAG